MKIINISFWF